ncbi:MAG: exonuclease [Nitrospirae bacterium]|nr:MAG: exonuclease [Nitrospirota bacterium]
MAAVRPLSMLSSTFIFLKGIGEATERRLWECGIHSWEHFLAAPAIPGIPPARKALYDRELERAIKALDARNARYFARLLKPRDHWRLFDTFRQTTAYVDIETTGAPAGQGSITVVGLYGKQGMKTFIHGESLDEAHLADEIASYDLLVTFYGSGFDLPFLRTQFPSLTLDHAHFDLCFAARRLGYRGGLKALEHHFGLARPSAIQGLTGWDAVELWRAWQAGDRTARNTLLAYNEADTKNLETLAEYVYQAMVARHGFPHISSLSS